MKHIRTRKKKNILRHNIFKPKEGTRLELDQFVIDLVLKCLYNNSDKSELSFEQEILKHSKIKLPHKEVSRLWNVLTASTLVAPTVGFGRAGKLELTHAGYQLMSQFGGYKEYIASVEESQKPQTIIMPFAVDDEEQKQGTQPEAGKK